MTSGLAHTKGVQLHAFILRLNAII